MFAFILKRKQNPTSIKCWLKKIVCLTLLFFSFALFRSLSLPPIFWYYFPKMSETKLTFRSHTLHMWQLKQDKIFPKFQSWVVFAWTFWHRFHIELYQFRLKNCVGTALFAFKWAIHIGIMCDEFIWSSLECWVRCKDHNLQNNIKIEKMRKQNIGIKFAIFYLNHHINWPCFGFCFNKTQIIIRW